MKYQPILGLEAHVELKTKSKMFCSCANDPNERHPNMLICPICTAQPGSLPVINKEAVRKTIKTGLALNCQIPEYSKFDRKNYFYPDLPKGYQISQLYQPFCKKGFLEIDGRKIRIREIHLEEDTGRLVHPEGADYSLVDFNRAGIPLMELVTEPDITSAREARKFAEELQLILRYLEVSDADMEKGQMRVEVNVSLTKEKGKLGTKVEIKNLNSFKAVERATNYEAQRQNKLLDKGEKIIQETRGWDDARGITVSQREKEEAHDYRYFPEPDLPPLHHSKKIIEEIKAEIPELPAQKRERFKREYNLDEKSIEIFVQNKDLGEYFEKIVSEFEARLKKEKLFKLIKLATNYLITDLLGLFKGEQFSEKRCKIDPENFAEFISLIEEGKISSKIAKTILQEMFSTGVDTSHIIKEKQLIQITDRIEIEKIIKEVISKNQRAIEDFKKGKENAFQFLIGQVMAISKGKADPQVVKSVLKKKLLTS
ncbi:MAG: Asp-tRNA(Asn)/Glu-tRNA(Gln) amidotransferase subunit GatB [Candidatus Nealsonbacteria bacterium CG_4_9_14_3_um_filter_35_11]|uniref:Aspartyl/glutamyl-tRNA(Asn/Gln) amidotransferase subunit B n=2 Tax=Candidatus Nealsoniibacteriota TaxID=1817911 RepID=A0A2M7DBC1_9BACT|nr:MAG: Asp-tRNA(Asn)/Glu-tRNA(Gln) amidotransferase GatCAB subunit B [Candidatus Nealsonbacteria bacterium CG11_big_fil_rev_8_21_14_0_20_35_11]PIV45758.1 MAG: Asp-tRNA(Asn)/Glu-tRNA(Gln) amidotransferase subunit GatB [Candidatus Nealsonbacteria bacterium CG02_land_8_20_14_3_00_34_20]PIW92698.1 MAG: Asp-tRNA(Asn)/Glu-tRNA(Gln) amidotransferase subunit GatB [Candidatus Nealsonbacteria bacterium CG_4_8_14_3_um_filter_34_13]PIZ89784.1 MAG: Asp-tRNA(Asn)/Glu-tRNA(Gln) amidotransferase subunit GatB [